MEGLEKVLEKVSSTINVQEGEYSVEDGKCPVEDGECPVGTQLIEDHFVGNPPIKNDSCEEESIFLHLLLGLLGPSEVVEYDMGFSTKSWYKINILLFGGIIGWYY